MTTPTINTQNILPPPPEIKLSWTPTVGRFGWTADGETFGDAYEGNPAAVKTESTVPVTFTATTIVPSGYQIILYEWDFGDGTIGTGPIVTHTYTAINPTIRVKVTVTDSLGRTTDLSRQLNLALVNNYEILVLDWFGDDYLQFNVGYTSYTDLNNQFR